MIESEMFSLDLFTYTRIYRAEQSKSMKKNILFFILILLFVTGISVYGYIKMGTLEVFFSWVPFIIMYSSLLILLHWLFPVYLYRNKGSKYSFTNRKYQFHEDALELETEDSVVSRMPYKVFVKKNIGNEYFALWENFLSVHMIPFYAFKSKADIELVKAVLSKNYT